MKIPMVLGLLLSSVAVADSGPYVKVAGGLDDVSPFSVKLASFGFQHPFFYIFDYQLETGTFIDSRQGSQTYFGSASLGVNVQTASGFYTGIFVGPAAVSQTDARLSTPYEINTDLEAGIKDARGVGMAVGYKHMSDAGICDSCSNLGRDFLFIKVIVPW